MCGAWHEDQPFFARERVVDPPGMIGSRVPVVRSVDEQHRHPNRCGGAHGRRLFDVEVSAFAGGTKRLPDEKVGCEPRRSIAHDGGEIRERFGSHDSGDPGLARRRL
jgi:hypothetical protein